MDLQLYVFGVGNISHSVYTYTNFILKKYTVVP